MLENKVTKNLYFHQSSIAYHALIRVMRAHQATSRKGGSILGLQLSCNRQPDAPHGLTGSWSYVRTDGRILYLATRGIRDSNRSLPISQHRKDEYAGSDK